MVHRIGNASGSLFLADGEGVSRVKERGVGIEVRIQITDFVVGLGARNHTTWVIFATRGSEGDDVDDGKCRLSLYLIGNKVPRVAVVAGASCDGLRAVEHRATTHGEDDIDVMLFAETHAIQHAGVVFRVGLDAREFHDFIAFQQFINLLIEADFLDAASTIGEEDFLSELRHHFGQFLDDALAKDEARRSHVIKVLHNVICLLFSI